jgi:predicted porin
MAVAGAFAMPAAALAQVTVFGTIDGGIRNQSKVQVGAGDESVMTVSDQIRTTNRWGLRGSEDLGGGLKANFWLEGNYLQGQSAKAWTASTVKASSACPAATGAWTSAATIR